MRFSPLHCGRLWQVLVATCLIASFVSAPINSGALGQTDGSQDEFVQMYFRLKRPVDHADIVTLMTTGKLMRAESGQVLIAANSGKLMTIKINDQTVVCIGDAKQSVKELQALIGQMVSTFVNVADLREVGGKPVYAVLVKDGTASMKVKMTAKPNPTDFVYDPIPCLQ
jgi:hypothetical protein